MRTFVVGDPQAPFEKFLAVLGHGGLLDSRGLVRDEVQQRLVVELLLEGRSISRSMASCRMAARCCSRTRG